MHTASAHDCDDAVFSFRQFLLVSVNCFLGEFRRQFRAGFPDTQYVVTLGIILEVVDIDVDGAR